ncbi:MAG TPA: nuclear transport factor 2 family protein [Solirubrobacteraceae bacterium]|nr:nuclear transport factor 2 family protein [Solirubrobacteraceae bacterium]
MDALEELLAKDAIRDLLARYPMAFDDRDWDAWNELWTEDLTWVVDGKAIEGLAAVREFMVGCLPHDYIAKHLCGPSVIEVAPDGQSARAFTDVVWIAANYDNQIVARYVDDLVKRDGRWLIRRREEIPVRYVPGPPPMSAASLDLSAPTMRKDQADG